MKGWTLSLLGTLLVLGLTFPLHAGSPTVQLEGTVSGAVCGTVEHMLCTHKPDPEHHYELLGLFTKDGKFFFLINVPQSVLRKVNREPVMVKGMPVEGYPALMVQELQTGDQVVFSTGEMMKMDMKHARMKSKTSMEERETHGY
jgi:hypothetical protein